MKRLSKSRRRAIIQRYKAGWGIVRLAGEYGISDTAVKKVLLAGGVRIRSPGRPRSQKDRSTIKDSWWEIWDLRQEGLAYDEIGKLMGVSRQYCHQVCEKVRERRGK